MGSGLSIKAQPGDQKGKFHEEKVSFFNEKLNLSDEKAKLFWPIHEDFHYRNMKINEDERTLLNYFNCNSEAMSDKEVDETITKFMDLQEKRAELMSQYHTKFVEVIGKKKTMKMYSLDREFRMYILKKFRSGGENKDDKVHGPNPEP
jgi:hypothetical protein